MEYQTQDKSHRLRNIILTIIIIATVVIIGVGLVIAALHSIQSSEKSPDHPSTEPVASQPDDRPAIAEPSSTSTSSPADQYNNKPTPTPTPAPTTTAPSSDDIPSTGPEDLLLPAVLIGAAIYLVGLNLQLVKSRDTMYHIKH